MKFSVKLLCLRFRIFAISSSQEWTRHCQDEEFLCSFKINDILLNLLFVSVILRNLKTLLNTDDSWCCPLDHVIISPELSPAEPEPTSATSASALFLRFPLNQSPVFAQLLRNQESPRTDGGLDLPRILSSTSSPIQNRDPHSHAANTG